MPCRLERRLSETFLGNNENVSQMMMNDYVHLSMIDRNVAKRTDRNEGRERCWMLKSINIENNSKAINRHAIGILLLAINGQILSLCLAAFVRVLRWCGDGCRLFVSAIHVNCIIIAFQLHADRISCCTRTLQQPRLMCDNKLDFEKIWEYSMEQWHKANRRSTKYAYHTRSEQNGQDFSTTVSCFYLLRLVCLLTVSTCYNGNNNKVTRSFNQLSQLALTINGKEMAHPMSRRKEDEAKTGDNT